jgi:hypothetical protein
MTTKHLLAGLATGLLAGALFAAPAGAGPKLWTDSSETVKLRSISSLPKNQPDELEFANEGPVEFRLMRKGFINPITCTEVELGTTVLGNESPVKKVIETRLAMPFGVAEGDDCNGLNSSGGPETVPTYFDTAASGAVPASIALTGVGPFKATIENLKLSQQVEKGTFCTVTVEKVEGEISNVTAGFVEESPPNLNMGFSALVPVACGKEKVSAQFNAKFILETMSTTTDTAFIGP